MIGLVRSELRKFFTVRAWWGISLAAFLLAAGLTALFGWFMVHGSMPTPDGSTISLSDSLDDLTLARMVYTQSISMGYLLTFVVGILVIGGEYRHKTITATLLAGPRRGQMILSKMVAIAVFATVVGLAHLAGSILGGGIMLASGGHSVFPEPGQLIPVLLRVLLVLILWALMGLGLGVLIPNQVVALFVGVAVVWIVEPLLGLFIGMATWGEDIARYLPAQVSLAAVDAFGGVDPETQAAMGVTNTGLDSGLAMAVLAGYAAVMALIGWVLTVRRDVS